MRCPAHRRACLPAVQAQGDLLKQVDVGVGDVAAQGAADVPLVGQVAVLAGDDAEADAESAARSSSSGVATRAIWRARRRATGWSRRTRWLLARRRICSLLILQVEERSSPRVEQDVPDLVEQVEPERVGLAAAGGQADDRMVSAEPPGGSPWCRGLPGRRDSTTPASARAAWAAVKPSVTERLVIPGTARATLRSAPVRAGRPRGLGAAVDQAQPQRVSCSSTAKARERRERTGAASRSGRRPRGWRREEPQELLGSRSGRHRLRDAVPGERGVEPGAQPVSPAGGPGFLLADQGLVIGFGRVQKVRAGLAPTPAAGRRRRRCRWPVHDLVHVLC